MPAFLPIIPGHQIIGLVEEVGPGVLELQPGNRVGVAWIYHACGACEHCLAGNENLCGKFQGTGCHSHGGYAEYVKVPAGFVYRIPSALSDLDAAPLLCAGAIGYRSLQLSNISDSHNLGLTGFGASAHLMIKVIKHQYPGTKVYVFARKEKERFFAKELGAVWAGDFSDRPPELLDAIIDTTPVWNPIVKGLTFLKPGGRLVINAIRKENVDQNVLLDLDYGTHLWMEKEIKTVANITRKDVRDYIEIAAEIPIKPRVEEYAFENANQALVDLKFGSVQGAKVLRVSP